MSFRLLFLVAFFSTQNSFTADQLSYDQLFVCMKVQQQEIAKVTTENNALIDKVLVLTAEIENNKVRSQEQQRKINELEGYNTLYKERIKKLEADLTDCRVIINRLRDQVLAQQAQLEIRHVRDIQRGIFTGTIR